jgi:hypothetical protein
MNKVPKLWYDKIERELSSVNPNVMLKRKLPFNFVIPELWEFIYEKFDIFSNFVQLLNFALILFPEISSNWLKQI